MARNNSFRYPKTRYPKIDYNFLRVLSPALCYFLGWCASDGSISRDGRLSFELQKGDIDVLYLFKSLLKSSHPIRIYKSRPSIAILGIRSIEMVPILSKYNIIPRKTYTVTIPDKIINNNEYFWSYLRGLFEGDGCICIGKVKWYVKKKKATKFSFIIRVGISGNEKMISKISNLLIQKGILNSFYKHKGHNECYRVLYIKGGKKGTIKFLDKLYENHNGLYLNRKYNKYLEAKKIFNV